jgi:hypothetical protein
VPTAIVGMLTSIMASAAFVLVKNCLIAVERNLFRVFEVD